MQLDELLLEKKQLNEKLVLLKTTMNAVEFKNKTPEQQELVQRRCSYTQHLLNTLDKEIACEEQAERARQIQKEKEAEAEQRRIASSTNQSFASAMSYLKQGSNKGAYRQAWIVDIGAVPFFLAKHTFPNGKTIPVLMTQVSESQDGVSTSIMLCSLTIEDMLTNDWILA